MKKKIIIDVATIYPGKGGAGGGIWSYAANLLREIDRQLEKATDIDFECLVNDEFPLQLKHLPVKKIKMDLTRFHNRFIYVHLYLPLYARRQGAVLHKLYFEVPLISIVPTIVTIHDCMAAFYQRKGYGKQSVGEKLKSVYFERLNTLAVKTGKLIFTPSLAVKNELIQLYSIDGNKVIVTPLAHGVQMRAGTSQKKMMDEPVRLFCIAAFHRHKGHLRLIEIFNKMMADQELSVELYFRGHINDESYYAELTESVNLSPFRDKIHFVAYEKTSGLHQIYERADWLVLLSEYEGFGLPVIEAQAAGIPVICSDLPVFREVAGDAATYLDVNASIASCAAQLYQVLSDPEKKQACIESGKQNAKRFSWDSFGNQMMKAYKNIVSEC